MKKIRLISLFCAMLILLMTATSCRCVPSSEEWHLFSYVKDVEFIGGVTRQFGFSTASAAYPFVNADFSTTKISFSDNGEMSFCTWDGEALNGTYTYEHIGNYTRIYIALENGESIEADAISDMQKKGRLVFNFRDVKYTFTDEKIEPAESMDDIIRSVKEGNADGLHPASVKKGDEGYEVWFSEMLYYPIDAETAVYAIGIAKDGSYTVLNEISEGEVLSTYDKKADYIILYYIEK